MFDVFDVMSDGCTSSCDFNSKLNTKSNIYIYILLYAGCITLEQSRI